jgi:hypothetical protein
MKAVTGVVAEIRLSLGLKFARFIEPGRPFNRLSPMASLSEIFLLRELQLFWAIATTEKGASSDRVFHKTLCGTLTISHIQHRYVLYS